MNAQEPTATAQQQHVNEEAIKKGPRLHLVYFALATFDLLTVLLSLSLFNRIQDIYAESVHVNQEWATRLEDYAELSNLAAAVSAPGNDIFNSRDLELEEAHLQEYSTAFDSLFDQVRDDLSSNVEPSQAVALLGTCDAIATTMEELLTEARLTFLHFGEERIGEAAQAHADMDHHLTSVNVEISTLGTQVRAIQKHHLDQQTHTTESLRQGELLITGLIALMVVCVTVYGHKLARRMKAVDQQTRAHLAELARYRQHLESLVEERTEELRDSHEKLRVTERLASIGTLAAGLGHDMNNVLFPVRCRLDTMESIANGEARLQGEVEAVRQSVDYLQRLSEGLRLMSLDPVDPDASGDTSDLFSLWEDTRSLFGTALPAAASLDAHFAKPLPRIQLAPHRLTQAIFNLLGNAGEAINEDGHVVVSAEATGDGSQIRISVRDDGHGMTPEVMSHALDPFFTTKTRSLSTGLGMALVQGIVRGAGGQLELDSTPGGGTTVTLLLPAVQASAGSRATDNRGEVTASISLQDRRVATSVSALLRSAGFRVRFLEADAAPLGSLWVTEAAPDRLERTRAFLEDSSRHQVIVYGNGDPEWATIDALTVNPSDGLDGFRKAIHALSLASESTPT